MAHKAFARRTALTGPLLAVLVAGTASAQNQPNQHAGFPVVLNESPTNQVSPVGSQVIAADLGLTPAGTKAIVFGLRNGKLYVLKHNGSNSWGAAPGWPVQLPGHVYSSPAIGDLNNDGQPDIVVGYGSTFDTGSNGGLRAFRRDGSVLWTVTTGDVTPGPPNGLTDPVMATPAIGDVNGDGQVDVVFGALDHRLYVVNGATGATINAAVWPKDMQDTVFSSPALFDLDSDGKLDIVTGTDDFSHDGGKVRVLRYDGTEFAGFPKQIDQVVSSSPAIGDIDGDGKPEIVVGTGSFYYDANNDTHGTKPAPLPRVYAWHCDGTTPSGWPVTTPAQVTTSPVLADIDSDGNPDVIVTAGTPANPATSFTVSAFRGNGTQIFSTLVKDFFGQNLNAGEPIVADVLGATTTPEILVPTNGEVAVFDAAGNQLTETDNFPDDLSKPNLMTQDSLAGVAVTDLETAGSSDIEVIAVSGQPFPNHTQTVVHAWNPVARATAPLWGFFHLNEKRTGVLAGTPPCIGACVSPPGTTRFNTVTPCRLIDTRNANGPYGGPVLASGGLRDFDLAGAAIGSCSAIPASAKAVSLNITVTGATSTGVLHMTQGCAPQSAVVLNFNAAQTRSSNAVIPLSSTGLVTVQAVLNGGGSVHVIIDVNGYFD